MNSYKVENIAAVISYIEAHLNEKLDLDTVAMRFAIPSTICTECSQIQLGSHFTTISSAGS